jgi:hypothetical protein
MFVGDPATTFTLTLAVTWPGLSWSSGVGELRCGAPASQNPSGNQERGRLEWIGWTKGRYYNRDLATGSEKWGSTTTQTCAAARSGKWRAKWLMDTREACFVLARVRQPRKYVLSLIAWNETWMVNCHRSPVVCLRYFNARQKRFVRFSSNFHERQITGHLLCLHFVSAFYSLSSVTKCAMVLCLLVWN